MLFLLFNVVFASAFTLIIKWVQVREREDIITVGAINYIVAAVWILPEFIQTDFTGDISPALLTGGVMGACYFIAFFFVIYAILWIGAASATVVGALSILMPIACGIFIWNEHPNSFQLIGVGLATASLMLVSGRQKPTSPEKPDDSDSTTRRWFRPLILVSFFLLAGLARLSQEAFKHESTADHRPMFLFSAFAVAAVPSLILLIVRRRRIGLSALALGFFMGASNILQTHFILRALKDYEGFVVFPVSSAGCLLLTTLVATFALGEYLDRRKWSGILMAVIALVLLNW